MSPIRMSERTSRLYYLVGGAIIAAIFAVALCSPSPTPDAVAMGFVPQPQQHQAQELPPPAPIATISLADLVLLEGTPGLEESVVDMRPSGSVVIARINLRTLIDAQRASASTSVEE